MTQGQAETSSDDESQRTDEMEANLFFYSQLDMISERMKAVSAHCRDMPASIRAAQCGDYEFVESMLCDAVPERRMNDFVDLPSNEKEYEFLPLTQDEDYNGLSPLEWSCLLGHHHISNVLLECGADLEHADEKGFTALMRACRQGHEHLVDLLLEKHADVNRKNDFGTTALMFASSMGKDSIAEKLIKHGADVNECNNEGDSALLWASGSGHLSLVKLLCHHGADVDHQNVEGMTATMLAAKRAHPKCVEFLAPIANTEAKSRYSMTALQYAQWEQNTPGHASAEAILQKIKDEHDAREESGRRAKETKARALELRSKKKKRRWD